MERSSRSDQQNHNQRKPTKKEKENHDEEKGREGKRVRMRIGVINNKPVNQTNGKRTGVPSAMRSAMGGGYTGV